MNQSLHEYGITEEESDIRAHVSLPGKRITVYQTCAMVTLLAERTYREATAGQPGVDGITSRGYLVTLDDIQPQYVLTSSLFPWETYSHNEMDLAARGQMAVCAVRAAILANRFPLWICCRVTTNKEIDIQGTDIVVVAKRRIQVKYDWLAYPKCERGSGNLFIQTHERNPLKIH